MRLIPDERGVTLTVMTMGDLFRAAVWALMAPSCLGMQLGGAKSPLLPSGEELVRNHAAIPGRRAAPQVTVSRPSTASRAAQWNRLVIEALRDIHRHGAGGYSVEDRAFDALIGAFRWDAKRRRPHFNPAGARPSFCSGAVYCVLLSALMKWDAAHPVPRISPAAWKALLPLRAKDGVLPWGYANANGPGFALLIRELGAGYSFTDVRYARPGDVMKIWWNDAIGGRERGHLVIFIKATADSLTFWSSNMPTDRARGGYGFKTIPRRDAKRILFTRITNPAAFNRAPRITHSPWLSSLLHRPSTWEECILRCGIRTAAGRTPAPRRP